MGGKIVRGHSGGERGLVVPGQMVMSLVELWIPAVALASAAKVGPDFQALPAGSGRRRKQSFCVRKARKVGKVLTFMTRTPFLTFLTFLASGAQKKAAG
jgi:hypothetical protein